MSAKNEGLFVFLGSNVRSISNAAHIRRFADSPNGGAIFQLCRSSYAMYLPLAGQCSAIKSNFQAAKQLAEPRMHNRISSSSAPSSFTCCRTGCRCGGMDRIFGELDRLLRSIGHTRPNRASNCLPCIKTTRGLNRRLNSSPTDSSKWNILSSLIILMKLVDRVPHSHELGQIAGTA